MKVINLLLIITLIINYVKGAYVIKETWDASNFFSKFRYFSGPDPTHGYVYYANQQESTQWGYTYTSNGKIHIRSDSTTVSTGSGRGSVRLESLSTYNRGLFVFDVQHMPWGCGNWPAIWTSNLDTWPNGGEIDILEGVNNNIKNQYTLHTGPGCAFPFGNCGANGGFQGCSVFDQNTDSYGPGFNNNGGGVFAMQWEASGIYIWFFPRNAIPANIQNNNPDPASWGTPRATFHHQGTSCNNNYFYNHHIIIDNTFCGDWAGAVFSQNGCGNNCQAFVQNNPGAFTNAYWIINSFKIYQ